jgi:hypothetical protein
MTYTPNRRRLLACLLPQQPLWLIIYPGSCFGLFSYCGSHFGQVFYRSSHFGRVSCRGNIPVIASRAAPASHNTHPSRLVFHLPTSRIAFHTNNLYQLDSADLPLRLIPVVPPNNAHKMNTRAKSGFPCLKSILTYLYLPHSHQFLPPTVQHLNTIVGTMLCMMILML